MASRADSQRTREALLDAAERLIAAHGTHAVPLRAINTAAGARNVSAAHYRFGSKDPDPSTAMRARSCVAASDGARRSARVGPRPAATGNSVLLEVAGFGSGGGLS